MNLRTFTQLMAARDDGPVTMRMAGKPERGAPIPPRPVACIYCATEHAPSAMRRITVSDGNGVVLDTEAACVRCIRGFAVTGDRSDKIEG